MSVGEAADILLRGSRIMMNVTTDIVEGRALCSASDVAKARFKSLKVSRPKVSASWCPKIVKGTDEMK